MKEENPDSTFSFLNVHSFLGELTNRAGRSILSPYLIEFAFTYKSFLSAGSLAKANYQSLFNLYVNSG